MSQQAQYYIGIDGGGTKCKALLKDSCGHILGEAIAGSANPASNLELAKESIVEAAQLTLQQANLPRSTIKSLHAGIGLAGVNLPKTRLKMEHWSHPFASMLITTDLHIACLGAHNGADGAIIISGTGSSAVAVKNNQHFEIGGHGFTAGDKGSGAWIGLTAVRASLEAMDGLAPTSNLVDSIKDYLKCSTAIEVAEIVNGCGATFYAGFAPLVFEAVRQQDPIALDIVLNGADYLSRIARRLLSNQSMRLSLIGGLASQITPWLDDDVKEQLSPPLCSPDFGAVLLIEQQQLLSVS